jgi:hypothetical protein
MRTNPATWNCLEPAHSFIACCLQGAKAAVVSLECCITHYGPFEYLPTAAFVDFLWQLRSVCLLVITITDLLALQTDIDGAALQDIWRAAFRALFAPLKLMCFERLPPVCSARCHPGTIYKYLAHLQAGEWQAPSGRIPLQAAVPQACGCTFLGAWLQARLQPAGASSEQGPGTYRARPPPPLGLFAFSPFADVAW